MLRSLKQARYAPDSLGHFALGFNEYAHFTSPIRRYPDLVVHRALKWALANPNGSPPPDPHPAKGTAAALYSQRGLEELATETSDAERRAATPKSKQRSWKLGDRVRVRAERIDPMRHRVEFALIAN